MSDSVFWTALAVPVLPLLGCLIAALFGPKVLHEKSHWPVVFGCGLAFCAAFSLLFVAGDGKAHSAIIYDWTIIAPSNDVAGLTIPIGMHVDSLSAIMLSMVTFIATLVALYASGYMHGERGYWRFFAEVGLFVFSMVMLVMSSNFLQIYMFWEAVGLCSYLLIGFWYEKPSAAAAGKKAFVVNRIGDFGFVTGVFLLWKHFGTVEYSEILFNPERLSAFAAAHPGIIELICFCLFAGAVGKSAQFPLHVWLPDAMEGPTPVSALIHAATMVTAGVYMVTRCTPLFQYAPHAQLVVCLIGGITAGMAGIIALTQTDLKRVLAYSTVSQLGYMFLGLGTGTAIGIAGGMFHLFTHAFFKALLFLGAGSVMHAMGGVIDMRRFSGLKRIMPVTYWTFLIGSLALAGVPPLAGFWSKDTILSALKTASNPAAHAEASAEGAGHGGTGHAGDEHAPAMPSREHVRLFGVEAATWYLGLYWLSVITAFLTAFYTFRAFFMTFHGPERIPEEAGHHAHESPPLMTIPLMILAVGAAVLGLMLGHLTGWFDQYLGFTVTALQHGHHPMDWGVAGLSLVVACGGVLLAYACYGRPSPLPEKFARAFGPLTRLSEHKFYLDEIYGALIVLPLRALSQISRFLDWILVDGAFVGFFTRVPADVARLVRPLQNGLVQFYALSMVLATAMLMWALLAMQRGS